jgi:NAD(P)-dependent dehydrogenase (short-subunit alcohol dehydrogenase family)
MDISRALYLSQVLLHSFSEYPIISLQSQFIAKHQQLLSNLSKIYKISNPSISRPSQTLKMPSTTQSPITLVIGASRGIGLEFVNQLAAISTNAVIATMRKPFDIQSKNNNVKVLQLDQTDDASVTSAAALVPEVDTLIINAAIGYDELLKDISSSRLAEYLDTNVVGPQRVVNAFLPALLARSTRKVVFLSSTAASLSGQVNETFGLRGPYAVSKAAANMMMVQYHNELGGQGFTVVSVHPGWVATEMGNLAGEGGMSTETSVGYVLKIVNGLRKEDGAKYFNYDGSLLAW